QQVDLRYVLVKCGDGAQPWRQFSPELVAALKAGGLSVYGWAYCYGDDVDGELAVAQRCLAAGADGYVADVEAEYEGRWREAERFADGLAELRSAVPGSTIGYSPLPVVDFHQSLPCALLVEPGRPKAKYSVTTGSRSRPVPSVRTSTR